MRHALFAALAAYVFLGGIAMPTHAQAPTAPAGDYAPPVLRIPDGARPYATK